MAKSKASSIVIPLVIVSVALWMVIDSTKQPFQLAP